MRLDGGVDKVYSLICTQPRHAHRVEFNKFTKEKMERKKNGERKRQSAREKSKTAHTTQRKWNRRPVFCSPHENMCSGVDDADTAAPSFPLVSFVAFVLSPHSPFLLSSFAACRAGLAAKAVAQPSEEPLNCSTVQP
jgi:hypothetical protein